MEQALSLPDTEAGSPREILEFNRELVLIAFCGSLGGSFIDWNPPLTSLCTPTYLAYDTGSGIKSPFTFIGQYVEGAFI